MKVILLSGKAGVGKNTYANYIRDNHTIVMAFADFLKESAVNIAGWDGEKDNRGRRLLQVLGDVVREYNKDRFVEIVASRINKIYEYEPTISTVIITDCRYDNEVIRLRDFVYDDIDVELIELHRTYKSPLSEKNANHPSEKGISDYAKWYVHYSVVDLDKERIK